MLNVYDLVKLPHGEAVKRVKQAGLWDENVGQEIKSYHIEYTMKETDEEIVEARSLSEAIQKIKDNMDAHIEVTDFIVRNIV